MTTENKQLAVELIETARVATLQVLRDEEAPPTARSSAIASALKIAEALSVDVSVDKAACEMTYEELQDAIMVLRGNKLGSED
jgi:hypothetical protein